MPLRRPPAILIAFVVVLIAGAFLLASSRIEPTPQEEPPSPEAARLMKIEREFLQDGSHRGLTAHLKETMNDPASYQHVKTQHWDRGDYLVVRTTFRAKNGFGALVIYTVQANVDLDGNVIEITSSE